MQAMLNMAIYSPFTLESNGSVKSIGCTQIKLYHFTDFFMAYRPYNRGPSNIAKVRIQVQKIPGLFDIYGTL